MIETIKYLPHFLQEVQELKEIAKVEDVELNNINSLAESVLSETIIEEASEDSIKRYEKIFNITNKESTLNERKFVIKSIFTNRPPFTLRWLYNKLNQIVGEGNYTVTIDYNNYKITIRIPYLFANAINVVKKDLRKTIPANMELEVFQNQNEFSEVYIGGITIQGTFEKLYER